jgi:hypothetical protein
VAAEKSIAFPIPRIELRFLRPAIKTNQLFLLLQSIGISIKEGCKEREMITTTTTSTYSSEGWTGAGTD